MSKNDFIAGRLVGELPDDVRRLMLRARFAFDLAATAEIFPERKLLYKAFDYLTLPLAPAIHQAAESLRIGPMSAKRVVGPFFDAPGIINTAFMIEHKRRWSRLCIRAANALAESTA